MNTNFPGTVVSLPAVKRERARVIVQGAVHGVGFRPFIFRLARALDLRGWVCNSQRGVRLEIEGPRPRLDQFIARLSQEKPPFAEIEGLESAFLDAVGYRDFVIENSDEPGPAPAVLLPDLAPCAACVREIFDARDRRHRYPFTNCTHCGPRFSIMEDLPYDRGNTAMKRFTMCPDCAREYHNPDSRRFHAQPNACPVCGPQLELWDDSGRVCARRDDAIREAAAKLRQGRIVAVKAVGGFQLLVDARHDPAVRRLRQRQHRAEKPFALLHPALTTVRRHCAVSDAEAELLTSAAAPVVLLQRRAGADTLAPAVAPGFPTLGVMLPASPLHHLLMSELGFPVVATSGKFSHETICTDEIEALTRLRGIADFFLVHDRAIVRPVDDSIVRVQLGHPAILRRARGYAPLPLRLGEPVPATLAVGAHAKNTVAVSHDQEICLSPHVGDLETPQAFAAFQRVAADLPRMLGVAPEVVACDLHPGYLSTKHAHALGREVVPVQHHYAHTLACMAEHQLTAPLLGVCWEGAGLGTDGTLWGGEFLLVTASSFERVGHCRTFRLPGGEAAMRQPRRSACGLLFEMENAGDPASALPVSWPHFSRGEHRLLRQMMGQKFNSPLTSSMGRLFDAVASLLGLRQRVSYDGQAAMELEFAVDPAETGHYPWKLLPGPPLVYDWAPTMTALRRDLEMSTPVGRVAARFFRTLAEVIVRFAREVDVPDVALTGECFQNRWLLEWTVAQLRAAGFKPCWPQRVPGNDGGIAFGQIIAAARVLQSRRVALAEAVT